MKRSFFKSVFSNNRVALCLICCTAVVIYSNIYNNPFAFDDGSNIVENSAVKDLSGFFGNGGLLEPRGVVELTFALNYRIGGLNVAGYHFFNILIHVLNGFLVYFLILAIFRQRPNLVQFSNTGVFKNPEHTIRILALFSSLIFVAHPIQTQAVTYTVQRYTSMAGMFYLCSMLLYAKARLVQRGKKKPGWVTGPGIYYGLSILFGMLAFLSKQNTASLPAAIVLLEYLLFMPEWREWKRKLPWFALVFFLWFLFVALVTGLFGSEAWGGELLEDVLSALKETETVGRWQYLCTQFNVLVIYMRLLFLPINQNLDYMYPFKTGFFDGLTPFAFFFLCIVAGIGAWNVKRRPVITFSIFFFFITLSIESSFIPISDALFEHRLYLPVFALGFLVAYELYTVLSQRPLTYLLVSLLVVTSLGTAAYRRNIIWQDNFTLWTDVISKSPHNYRAHNNLGYVLLEQGRSEEAIVHLHEAIRIKPGFAKVHNNLGIAFVQQGSKNDAVKSFNKALRIDSSFTEAHYNKANVLVNQGRLDEAVFHYSEALRTNPYDKEIHNNLGNVLLKKGETDKAIKHFLEVLKIDPNDAYGHSNMGIALVKKGAIDTAVEYFKKAIKINSDFNDARYNLGITLAKQGKLAEAAFNLDRVLKIDPDYPNASSNLKKIIKAMEQSE